MGNNCYRLVGGVFFALIIKMQNKRKRGSLEKGYGKKDSFTDSDIYNALFALILPEGSQYFRDSLAAHTSSYKACTENSNLDSKKNNESEYRKFDANVKNKYEIPLQGMNEFVTDYITLDNDEIEGEIKELIALIQQDNSILPEQEFYINPDGSTTKKEQLNTLDHVCLPAFLLGVWHYIAIYCEDNKSGKGTADELYPKENSSPRNYVGCLGKGIQQNIEIIRDIKALEENNEQETKSDIGEEEKLAASQGDPINMVDEQEKNDGAEDNSHHEVEEEEETLNDDAGFQEKETAGKIFNSTVVGSYNQVNIYNNYGTPHGDSATPTIQNMGTIQAPFTKQGIVAQEITSSEPINRQYYNLFVVQSREQFNEKNGFLELDYYRLLKGNMEITAEERFKKLLQGNFEELLKSIKVLPSLFMLENKYKNPPKADDDQFAIFGYVKDIELYRSGYSMYAKVRFSKIRCDIKQQLLNEHAEDFDLLWKNTDKINDLNQTHWSIKKRDLIEELRKIGIDV